MSLGAGAIGELPIGADPPVKPKNNTPPGRTTTAVADVVQPPEAR